MFIDKYNTSTTTKHVLRPEGHTDIFGWYVNGVTLSFTTVLRNSLSTSNPVYQQSNSMVFQRCRFVSSM